MLPAVAQIAVGGVGERRSLPDVHQQPRLRSTTWCRGPAGQIAARLRVKTGVSSSGVLGPEMWA
jgi:hypothetical protein